MTRPKDYGKQFPSDDNDSTPDSPLGNLTETGESRKAGPLAAVDDTIKIKPDLEVDAPKPDGRIMLVGIILEETSDEDAAPRLYDVLLENGNQVTAQVTSVNLNQQYSEKQVVAVFLDTANQYHIFSPFQYKTLAQITAHNTNALTLTDEVAPVDTATLKSFNGLIRIGGGKLIVSRKGLYQLSFGTNTDTEFPHWVLAQSVWVKDDATGFHTQSVKLCEDKEGTNPTGIAFNVIVQSQSGHPNIASDQTFVARQTNDGDWVPVDNLIDARISTVEAWSGAKADIPQGWQEKTNLRDKFIRGAPATAATADTPGGTAQHNHNEHIDHAHKIQNTGNTREAVPGSPTETYVQPEDECTSGAQSIGCGSLMGLEHDFEDHLPEYLEEFYIERIHNV